MAKRTHLAFTHRRKGGSVELLDGRPSMISWGNLTCSIECCCPEMRASIDQAIFNYVPEETAFRRIARLEDQLRALGAKLEQAMAHLDLLMGGALRGD